MFAVDFILSVYISKSNESHLNYKFKNNVCKNLLDAKLNRQNPKKLSKEHQECVRFFPNTYCIMNFSSTALLKLQNTLINFLQHKNKDNNLFVAKQTFLNNWIIFSFKSLGLQAYQNY